MIRHLFRLIWNKKKQNFLMMLEMLFSFIVIFAVFTLLVYCYQNYHRPMGFDYKNVWSIKYNDPDGMHDADSITTFNTYVKQLISSLPRVEAVSFSNINVPFGDANIATSLNYKNISLQTEIYRIDDDYKKVLGINVTEGSWFSKGDNVAREKPVVINETLKENLFGYENAVGKFVSFGSAGPDAVNMKIVGVINDLKDKGDFVQAENGLYTRADSANQGNNGAILVKVKPGTDAVFESHLYKLLSSAVRSTSIDILHLDQQRISKVNQMMGPMIVLFIVAGFLIINVILGLFGVLWYNINKRRAEIGLRRAMGASGNSISKQMVGEALVLSTISLAAGSFFAIQFPLMNVFDLPANIYLIALFLSVIFIYLLVLVCALYPGKQAAAIYPAVALHED